MHLLERSTSEGQGLDCHMSSLVDSLPALPGSRIDALIFGLCCIHFLDAVVGSFVNLTPSFRIRRHRVAVGESAEGSFWWD